VAVKEFDRQKLLFEKNYTSQAALERAEAQFKATQAQVSAQLAQAGAARAQSGFFVVRAPYGGVIADVPAMLGDMAMPGRPLLTIYDPASLRVLGRDHHDHHRGATIEWWRHRNAAGRG
jgi:multidrug resistance efflux pump